MSFLDLQQLDSRATTTKRYITSLGERLHSLLPRGHDERMMWKRHTPSKRTHSLSRSGRPATDNILPVGIRVAPPQNFKGHTAERKWINGFRSWSSDFLYISFWSRHLTRNTPSSYRGRPGSFISCHIVLFLIFLILGFGVGISALSSDFAYFFLLLASTFFLHLPSSCLAFFPDR